MSVCVGVYACACVHACICVCVTWCVRLYVLVRVNKYAFGCTFMCVCVYERVYVLCVYMSVGACVDQLSDYSSS